MKDKDKLLADVNTALEDVRPHLYTDGGDVEVVDITPEMVVLVKWMGNCSHCNMSDMTLKAGIEQTIRTKMPLIKGVEVVN